jgi:2-phospho-L-lactate guanylyltransferase
MQAMVEDVLSALAGVSSECQVLLVSDDPGAALLAEVYGVRFIDERTLGCSGLNEAVTAATSTLTNMGCDSILVLHGDIPTVSTEELEELICHKNAESVDVILVPDRYGQGTNAILRVSPQEIEFRFGADSFANHSRMCAERGLRQRPMELLGFGLDIDEPDDLQLLLDRLEATPQLAVHTRKMLLGGELENRLRLVGRAQSGFEAGETPSRPVDTGVVI